MSQPTSDTPGPLGSAEPLFEDEMCAMPLSVNADCADWPASVEALGRVPGSQAQAEAPCLAELTTLRVGGPVGRYVEAPTRPSSSTSSGRPMPKARRCL